MEDVAVGIVEPDQLRAAGDVNIAFEPADVRIMFEGGPLRLQRGDDRVQFLADAPGDGIGAVGAGMIGAVDDPAKAPWW